MGRASAAAMEASPMNPETITTASQVANKGNSSQASRPANAPTSVATPLPPRKPCHTGKQCPRMDANPQTAGSQGASSGGEAEMPGNTRPGSQPAASQPLA